MNINIRNWWSGVLRELRELRELLRSLWEMRHFAFWTEYFPLTLTLSLREREQQASDWCLAYGRWANSRTGVIERRWSILPLPKGEGRGEGEPSVAHPTIWFASSRPQPQGYRPQATDR